MSGDKIFEIAMLACGPLFVVFCGFASLKSNLERGLYFFIWVIIFAGAGIVLA